MTPYEKFKQKYDNDIEFRNKMIEYKKNWNQTPQAKYYQKAYRKNQYQNNPEFKEKVINRMRKYRYKQKVIQIFTIIQNVFSGVNLEGDNK